MLKPGLHTINIPPPEIRLKDLIESHNECENQIDSQELRKRIEWLETEIKELCNHLRIDLPTLKRY